MTKLKVNLEYVGTLHEAGVHEYRITRITGAPVVEMLDSSKSGLKSKVLRVGDLVTERVAEDIAKFALVETTKREAR